MSSPGFQMVIYKNDCLAIRNDCNAIAVLVQRDPGLHHCYCHDVTECERIVRTHALFSCLRLTIAATKRGPPTHKYRLRASSIHVAAETAVASVCAVKPNTYLCTTMLTYSVSKICLVHVMYTGTSRTAAESTGAYHLKMYDELVTHARE